jgi:hypothetical protein
MRHARDILGRVELVACVAIAAASPNVHGLPSRQRKPDGPYEPPTPTEWAEHVVKHGEALRKTLRWAWAARVEE